MMTTCDICGEADVEVEELARPDWIFCWEELCVETVVENVVENVVVVTTFGDARRYEVPNTMIATIRTVVTTWALVAPALFKESRPTT